MGSLIYVGENSRTYLRPDNVMSEGYAHTAQVTNHPIGVTSKPADHRLDEPMLLDLVLRITESPLASVEGLPNPMFFSDVSGEVVEAANSATVVGLASGLGSRPRSIAFYSALKASQTGIWEYLSEGMGLAKQLVIVGIDFEVRTVRHVDFHIQLQEIEFIEAQRVNLPVLKVLKKAPETCPTVPTGDKAKTALSKASDISPTDRSILQTGGLALTGTSDGAGLAQALDGFGFNL